MEFRAVLPELGDTLNERLDLIISSCQELKLSRKLNTMLIDIILPLGNRLNQGSRKAMAAGIRIGSLNKIVQTKAQTGDTFLRFIVEGIVANGANKLLLLHEDFPQLLRAKGNLISS